MLVIAKEHAVADVLQHVTTGVIAVVRLDVTTHVEVHVADPAIAVNKNV